MTVKAVGRTARRYRPVGLRKMDPRLLFLADETPASSSLPVHTTFEHRAPGASGLVEAIYWPAKSGVASPPAQLTLFILGMWSRRCHDCADTP